MAIQKDQVTIVIPTLNEQEGINMLLQELKQQGYDQILVVDAHSVDKTVENAQRNGAKVVYQHGWGKGKAIKTAVEHVNTPYMLIMDGDYTYDPKDISDFLTHAENYDHIIGARVNGRKNISRLNRFGNWTINKVFNILIGGNLTDVCSGMYLLKTETAKQLELNSTGFDVEVEIAAQTVSEGKVTEIPISYRKRIGNAKLSSWKHGFQIISCILKLARFYNPVLLFSAFASLAIIPAFVILFWVFLQATLYSTYHSGYALMGGILLLLGSQALTVGAISILLKKFEYRIKQKLRNHSLC
jgi:dolichol-phosphate mannosyltransferase